METNETMQQQAAAEKTVTKVYTRCGRELPIYEFYENKKTKDGHFSECKECTKERNKLSRKRRAERFEAIKEAAKKNSISDYTPRELMQSLAKRGFYGILHYDTEVEKDIVVDGHKGTFRYKETKDIDITNF